MENIGNDYDGRAVVDNAMEVLRDFFEGQSDAYWGFAKHKYVSRKRQSVYDYGYDTYHNPPKDQIPSAADPSVKVVEFE